MSTRRTGLLTALLLTAALLCAMPGLWRSFWQTDPNRMAESLRPARAYTLTVWLLPGETSDRACLNAALAAFEKAHPGARVFLRSVTAEELWAEAAVLPDAVLFEPGAFNQPQRALLPLALEGLEETSGTCAGQRYAVPLWLEPHVLTLPETWLSEDGTPLWAQAAAALDVPQGVAQQQLLFTWPAHLRQELVQLALGASPAAPTAAPAAVWSTTLPMARGASPTAVPPSGLRARVQTLARHIASDASAGVVLRPAVSDHVRYIGLCRDSEASRALLRFLMDWQADAERGLIPLHAQTSAGGIAGEALALYQQGYVLPNAFSHTAQERKAVCADAFRRAEDPAQTILRLR